VAKEALMQTLPILIAEMRMLGVKRLELELDALTEEQSPETLPAPEPTYDEKPDGACAYPTCNANREGLFGGSTAAKYCRAHALAEAGVKL
jgi:hypothetical protein